MKRKDKSKYRIMMIAASVLIIIMIIIALLLSRCERYPAAEFDPVQPTQTVEATNATEVSGVEPSAVGSSEPNAEASSESKSGATSVKNPTEAKTSGSTAIQPTTNNSGSGNTSPTNAPTPSPTSAPVTPKPTTAPSSPATPKPTTAPKATEKPTADPHDGRTYHEAVYKTVHHDAVYEDVYVVVQEATTYEEPIYEERQITICHVCGAEFDTSDENGADLFTAHDKAHMLAGEGSGYHSTVRKVQVGTKTVEVPEQGYYVKRLVKEAWDEKVLVREAGWY